MQEEEEYIEVEGTSDPLREVMQEESLVTTTTRRGMLRWSALEEKI